MEGETLSRGTSFDLDARQRAHLAAIRRVTARLNRRKSEVEQTQAEQADLLCAGEALGLSQYVMAEAAELSQSRVKQLLHVHRTRGLRTTPSTSVTTFGVDFACGS